MFSLIQVLVSVALLSFVLGSPVTEGNVIGGLALNMPGGGGEGGGNLPIDFGKEASRGQFSHHVLVREAGISGRRVPYCGGSIISNRFVLTAAVCKVSGVPNEAVDVVVGVHNYDADNHITYKVNEWIVHDEYYRQVSAITSIIVRNDIALIKTDKPIEFNDVIAPIALHHDFFVGEEPVLLSGWSQVSHNLSYINLVTVSNPTCRKLLQGVLPKEVPVHDWDTLCVASNTSSPNGLCKANNGSPLVAGKKLIGIASWKVDCAKLIPDGFTRISTYIDWINEKTKLSL